MTIEKYIAMTVDLNISRRPMCLGMFDSKAEAIDAIHNRLNEYEDGKTKLAYTRFGSEANDDCYHIDWLIVIGDSDPVPIRRCTVQPIQVEVNIDFTAAIE